MNKQIKLNIHEIEQLLWNSVLETFQQAMLEILSMLDDFLTTQGDGRLCEKSCKPGQNI